MTLNVGHRFVVLFTRKIPNAVILSTTLNCLLHWAKKYRVKSGVEGVAYELCVLRDPNGVNIYVGLHIGDIARNMNVQRAKYFVQQLITNSAVHYSCC